MQLQLLRPGQVQMTSTYVDDWTEAITVDEKPLVAYVDDAVLRRHELAGPILSSLGYRYVETDYSWRHSLYARPPQLAWLLRRRKDLRAAFWHCMGWLHDRGILHLKYEGVVFRWRDVRLGRRG